MKRKSLIIQQDKVTALMTELANLPECEKNPNDPVSLSEIFRTKEYAAEVKAALKKGYSFENLAAIFTERCSVAVSARQIKYHFTRGKNRGMKSKPGKKAGEAGASAKQAMSVDSSGKTAAEGVKENLIASDSRIKTSPNVSRFSLENRAVSEAEGNVDSDAFSIDTWRKGS
jgi:hypothetical protein